MVGSVIGRAGRSGCAANLTEHSEPGSSLPESQTVEVVEGRRARGVVDDMSTPRSSCCFREPVKRFGKRVMKTRLLTTSLKIQCRAFLLRGCKAASSACSLGLAGDRPELWSSRQVRHFVPKRWDFQHSDDVTKSGVGTRVTGMIVRAEDGWIWPRHRAC